MSHKRIHNSFKTFRNVKTFTINNNDFPDLSIQKNVELQNEQNMNYKEVAQWKEPSKLENNGEFNLKPGWLKIYYKDGKIQKEYTSEYNKRNVTNRLDVNNNIKIHLKTYKERYDSSWGEGEYERIYGSNYQQQQKDFYNDDGSDDNLTTELEFEEDFSEDEL